MRSQAVHKIWCTHQRAILTQISRRAEGISVKIGAPVGTIIKYLCWISRGSSPDLKLRRQFKIEKWQHMNVVCRRSITANHTKWNMLSCTYSSALRGHHRCFFGLLSSWWEIFSRKWVKNSPRMFFTRIKSGVSIKPIKDPFCYDLNYGRNLTVRMAMNPSIPLPYSGEKDPRSIFHFLIN